MTRNRMRSISSSSMNSQVKGNSKSNDEEVSEDSSSNNVFDFMNSKKNGKIPKKPLQANNQVLNQKKTGGLMNMGKRPAKRSQAVSSDDDDDAEEVESSDSS